MALALRLDGKACLLVIDDVWTPTAMKPFLQCARSCATLITTRQLDVAMDARRIHVDAMRVDAKREGPGRRGRTPGSDSARTRPAGSADAPAPALPPAGARCRPRRGRGFRTRRRRAGRSSAASEPGRDSCRAVALGGPHLCRRFVAGTWICCRQRWWDRKADACSKVIGAISVLHVGYSEVYPAFRGEVSYTGKHVDKLWQRINAADAGALVRAGRRVPAQ
jgi:hypothetical protein